MQPWTEDCGDAHCIFAVDASGQRTQGGCRHLKDLVGTPMSVRGLVREAAAVVVSQRRELEAARAERDEALAALERGGGWHVPGYSEPDPVLTERHRIAARLRARADEEDREAEDASERGWYVNSAEHRAIARAFRAEAGALGVGTP